MIIYRKGRLGVKHAEIGDGQDKTILFAETREEKYAAWTATIANSTTGSIRGVGAKTNHGSVAAMTARP